MLNEQCCNSIPHFPFNDSITGLALFLSLSLCLSLRHLLLHNCTSSFAGDLNSATSALCHSHFSVAMVAQISSLLAVSVSNCHSHCTCVSVATATGNGCGEGKSTALFSDIRPNSLLTLECVCVYSQRIGTCATSAMSLQSSAVNQSDKCQLTGTVEHWQIRLHSKHELTDTNQQIKSTTK